MNRIFITESLKNKIKSLNVDQQCWLKKVEKSLRVQVTGKKLQYEWFLEKRYKNNRLYFLYDRYSKKILFITLADKKRQQTIINKVVQNKNEWLTYLKKL